MSSPLDNVQDSTEPIKTRQDNIDLQDLQVDVGDVEISDEPVADKNNEAVEEEEVEEVQQEEAPAPPKNPVKDFYNHRQRNKVKREEEELRKKYADLEVDDDPALDSYKLNRRALCEKLESDPEFKKKYIAAEEKRRARKKEEEELEAALRAVKNKEHQKQLEEGEPIPDDIEDDGEVEDLDDSPSTDARKARNCVYIERVENLTINFRF